MKTYQVMCPDCGGVLAEGTDYRALLGQTHTCDGPHDEDVTFVVQSKDVMIKRDEIAYHKLVRDKIPEIIKADGSKCKTHVAKRDEEYWMLLQHKLNEEVTEFLFDVCPEEIADILEVIEAIARFKGISLDEIKEAKLKKRLNRGSFNKRIVLETTTEKFKLRKGDEVIKPGYINQNK